MPRCTIRDEIEQVRDALRRLANRTRHFDQSQRSANVNDAQKVLNTVARLLCNHPSVPELRDLHREAANRFHLAIAAAYPRDFWDDYDRLRGGDASGLETAVRFLESDPWFFRSGYVKADLIRFIKRLDLAPEYVARLRQVVLAAIDSRDRREFRSYCRLAQKVNAPEWRNEVSRRLQTEDEGIRRRARWVLEACRSGGG
jgi:hypothetical protein